MKRFAVLVLPLLLLAGGCGASTYVSDERMAIASYDPNYLWHLKRGRDCVAQGRYELAKEHYLMALAASNSAETRDVASHELKAADLMIKAQR